MSYSKHCRAIRRALGRLDEPRLCAQGESVTFQIMDVVVSDTLASAPAEVTNAVSTKVTAELVNQKMPWGTPTVVTLFGCTAEGNSVCCRVLGFRPSCHILLPDDMSISEVHGLQDHLRKKSCSCSEVSAFNFFGFKWDATKRERKRNRYLKVTCTSVAAYQQLRWGALDAFPKVKLVEHEGVPLYTKFNDDTQLEPFAWITVTASSTPGGAVSTADIELVTYMGQWTVDANNPRPAPYLFASCDIECVSDSGDFPNQMLENDVVAMIGVVFQRFGQSEKAVRVAFLLDRQPQNDMNKTLGVGSTDPEIIDGRDGPIQVLRFRNEKTMLEAWRDLVCVYADADVVLWYNGFRFDLPYLAYRVLGHAIDDVSCTRSRFFQFSKFLRHCTPLRQESLTSAAMGDNEMWLFKEEYGRITVDLYQLIKTREKLSSYSLDEVCKHILTLRGGTVSWKRGDAGVVGTNTCFTKLNPGDTLQLGDEFYGVSEILDDTRLILSAVPADIDCDISCPFVGQITKVDYGYQDMFRDYKAFNYEQMIVYCDRDCYAPLLLLWKQMYFLNDIEMCKVTVTPIQQLYTRGQGIKGVNQVIRFAHSKDFLLNTGAIQADRYKGATVLEPAVGFHTSPVVTLDFMSLYPSIIISHWLCWTTVVLDHGEGQHADVIYEDIEVDEGVTYRFAQAVQPGPQNQAVQSGPQNSGTEQLPAESVVRPQILKDGQVLAPDATRIDSVCPTLLRNLLAARKVAKGELAKATDPHLKKIKDAKQQALKISANSIYGLTGAGVGILACKPIARATTACGRIQLERTKGLVVQLYPDAQVIYGDTDSVMVKLNLPFTHEGVLQAWNMGAKAAKWITQQLNNGIILDCEKVYMPYLLCKKKNYAGTKYSDIDNFLPHRDVKGMEMVKRDTSRFIRRVQSRMVDCMLSTGDKDATLRLVGSMVADLCDRKVPVSQLITSKSLKREYKTEPMQAIVNARRAARNPGSEYKPGERVPMVAVERTQKTGHLLMPHNTKVCDMMEDPDYVATQPWMKPNRHYYLEDMRKKVERVLFFDAARVNALFNTSLEYINSQRFNQPVFAQKSMKMRIDRVIAGDVGPSRQQLHRANKY